MGRLVSASQQHRDEVDCLPWSLCSSYILTLGDVPQESSQDVAEASEFGLLDREAREAGRKKRKGNKRNKKGKRNGKKLRGRKRKNKGKGKGKAKGKGKQGTE